MQYAHIWTSTRPHIFYARITLQASDHELRTTVCCGIDYEYKVLLLLLLLIGSWENYIIHRRFEAMSNDRLFLEMQWCCEITLINVTASCAFGWLKYGHLRQRQQTRCHLRTTGEWQSLSLTFIFFFDVSDEVAILTPRQDRLRLVCCTKCLEKR